jgi:3-phenylpropionate/trans-cinnamate dioxygenase ferredoxin reductase subunit
MNQLRSSDHVIVVGAGLAGWRFVRSLRSEGYDGAITLVGDERHAPYDRPPLSKQVLVGKWPIERTTIATTDELSQSNATLRFGVRAVNLDVATMTIELDDGTSLKGTHVVIATGARARTLAYDSSGPLQTLRSIDDARSLLERFERLVPSNIVAVIGGGFVGAEVATSLKSRGITPVVLELAERPLFGVLGDEVSGWLSSIPEDNGVEVRVNQRIVDATLHDDGYVVNFADGSTLAAQEVVAAVGSDLALDWLTNSGITLDHGVVVDENLECAPRIAAIGDVARFPLMTALGSEMVRVEHWQVATDHATQLARWWANERRPDSPMVPYFWSDQYAKKLQVLGHPRVSDGVVMVAGDVESRKWLGIYSCDGLVTALVSLNQPRALMLAKSLIEVPTTLDDALRSAPWRE